MRVDVCEHARACLHEHVGVCASGGRRVCLVMAVRWVRVAAVCSEPCAVRMLVRAVCAHVLPRLPAYVGHAALTGAAETAALGSRDLCGL